MEKIVPHLFISNEFIESSKQLFEVATSLTSHMRKLRHNGMK